MATNRGQKSDKEFYVRLWIDSKVEVINILARRTRIAVGMRSAENLRKISPFAVGGL